MNVRSLELDYVRGIDFYTRTSVFSPNMANALLTMVCQVLDGDYATVNAGLDVLRL